MKMKLSQNRLSEQLGIDVSCFREIDSTSLYAKRLISENAHVPALIVAETQTNGQGRVGKSFYSPSRTGLYMTFTFCESDFSCDHLTPRAALAVANAIDDVFHIESKIKWVNDIYFENRKVCGILVQRVLDRYLVGIGINVEKPNVIPDDLVNRFGYLTEKCDRALYEKLVVKIHSRMKEYFCVPESDALREYRARCVHIGSDVILEQNGEALHGLCVGIGDDFTLLVEHNGKICTYTSGYMTLKIEI